MFSYVLCGFFALVLFVFYVSLQFVRLLGSVSDLSKDRLNIDIRLLAGNDGILAISIASRMFFAVQVVLCSHTVMQMRDPVALRILRCPDIRLQHGFRKNSIKEGERTCQFSIERVAPDPS